MSYPGIQRTGSGSNNGYWNGNGTPNATSNQYAAPTQLQRQQQQPRPQYINPQIGQGQYQNPPLHFDPRSLAQPPTLNGTQSSPSIQPQGPNTQFINPAQLFQPVQPTYQTSYEPSPQPSFNPQVLNMAPSSSARIAAVRPPPVTLDRSTLLMSLAEEYFDAAHKLAPAVSTEMTAANVDEYEKLVATGLGCLDTALKHVKLTPRVEANIRLRYAGVLYEETENFMEAETALSKGIALCERVPLHFPYTIILLTVVLESLLRPQICYAILACAADVQKKPKGINEGPGWIYSRSPDVSKTWNWLLPSADGVTPSYQHYSWVYAMRFLRASYSLESGTPSDINAALSNFRAIANLSEDQSDRAIYMAASLMEGMTHLRSNSPDSMEQAQQAIAQVWTYQLDSGAQIPQLLGLAHILDVACSIQKGNPQEMIAKLNDMQKMMDRALKDENWSATSDIVAIPINRRQNSSQVVSPDTRMILGIGDDGRDNLMLSFLTQQDAYAIRSVFIFFLITSQRLTNSIQVICLVEWFYYTKIPKTLPKTKIKKPSDFSRQVLSC
jgi:hypothetical protein